MKKQKNYKLKIRSKLQSTRQQQVAALITAAVVKYMSKGAIVDARLIDCHFTITKVTVSGDLQIANCFFLPLSTKVNSNALLEAFEFSKQVIRKFVAHEIQMKFAPELRFFVDTEFEKAAFIDELLHRPAE